MSETIDILAGQFIVPTWMQDRFFTIGAGTVSIPWSTLPKAGVQLFTRSPLLDPFDLNGIVSVQELQTRPGWLPVKGNFTSIGRGKEMGDLRFQLSNVGSVYTITLLSSTDSGTWEPALLEDGKGWAFSTGGSSIEQETASVAAVYLRGTYDGVVDPVLFLSDQGMGRDANQATLIRGGSLYGMTKYAEQIAPSVMTNTFTIDKPFLVTEIDTRSEVTILTTQVDHTYAVGDLIRVTPRTGALTIARIINVIDSRHVQTKTAPGKLTGFVKDYTSTITLAERFVYDFRPGTVLLDTPPSAFEPNNLAHAWLRPQRMNLIANPAFLGPTYGNFDERAFGWKVGRTGEPGQPGVFSLPSSNYGKEPLGVVMDNTTSGRSGRLVLESNLFPVRDNNFISVALNLFGKGIARIGVVAWDEYYSTTTYIRLESIALDNMQLDGTDGPSIVGYSPTKFTALVPTLPSTSEYNLRIEWEQEPTSSLISNVFVVQNILVDPTDGKTTYFDGSTNDTLPGDYHWHGNLPHQQFSMWYNNRKNTESRLFGGLGGAIGDEDVFNIGLLNEWTPSSTNVVAHWDAIEGAPLDGWIGDYFYPVKDVSNDPILKHPYQELGPDLKALYPTAVTDEFGALLRTPNGDPIIIEG